MNKIPTIKDVAKLSNTSPATVSRALQQPHLVSKKTQKRIQEAIKELNYQVNTAAQTLRSRKSYTILVVVPNIKNPFFSKVFDGILCYAEQQDYTVFIANTNGNEEQEYIYVNQLLRGRVDGIILLNGKIPPSLQEQLDLPTAPIVFACEYPYQNITQLPIVKTNNSGATEELINLLIRHGHRKIGFLNGPPKNSLNIERYSGYKKSLEAANIKINNQYYFEGDYESISGVRAAQYFMTLKDLPTAIFCASDEMAIGLIYELQVQGIKVPQDISVVGFDDIDFSSKILPALTTIAQDAETIGYKATEALFARINAEKTYTQWPLEIPHKIIERDSHKTIL